MSTEPATVAYDCEQVGDRYVLMCGRFRLEAEGARWVGGAGSEIKATIRIFDGTRLADTVSLNLTQRQQRKRTLKEINTDKGVLIPDTALVSFEDFIRDRLPRPLSDGEPTAGPVGAAPVELTDAARALASDPRFLERLSEAVQLAGGWAGDARPPMLGYVAMTSCLLVDPARPINLAFVAQASTGKNKAVDAALSLLPPERVYLQRAGSEKSLIYISEPLQYRAVIFAEADSIPDEGPAASAIRSLASDNVLAYDVPEQDPETNKFVTRRINLPGPTGLLTTSTRSLQYQLGTRVLEVPLPDDQAQTERILMMQAAACDGSPRATFDVTPWVAFQSWLSAQAPYRVRVPYARALVALVPTRAVRMRRDFPQLLSCIQTIAVLHQMQRARADDGAIIATLDDYVAARDLLSPIFDSTAADGITPAIRETVEAVPEGGPEMSTSALRAKLKVEKGTISWRVNRAIKQGWLKNLETKKGHPARLVRGEPLPAPAVALPPVERVREVFESSQSDLSRNQSTSSNEVFECSNGFPGEGAPPVFEVGEL